MKKILALFSIGVLVSIADAGLINGGFEDTGSRIIRIKNPPGTTYDLPGWRIFNTDVNTMTFEVIANTALASEGNNFLKVTSVESVAGKDGGLNTTTADNLASGVTYTVSFDLRHVSGVNSVIMTLENAGIEVYVTETLTPPPMGWRHYSYEITPTQDGSLSAAFRPKTGVTIQDEVFFLDNVDIEIALPENPIDPATIIGWSSFSSNMMRMVVDAPDEANNYYLRISNNLASGGWENAAHSDNGVNAFVVTNLDYSTSDATGTNEVVYIKTDLDAGCFKVDRAEDFPVLKGFIVSDSHFGWDDERQPSPQQQREFVSHSHERFPDLDVFIDTGDAHQGDAHQSQADADAARGNWSDVIANQSNQALFYSIPGNHDVLHIFDGDAELRDAQMGSWSYRPYYSFDIKGIHFVSVPELTVMDYVNKETMDWLRMDLELNRDKTTILLSHNLIAGANYGYLQEGVFGIVNSEEMLNLINAYPNVIAWMNGHQHLYDISRSFGKLFVCNGHFGAFGDPALSSVVPWGGIYFEITPRALTVRCYSVENQLFLDQIMEGGADRWSQTLAIPTTMNPQAPMNYAFGHGGFLDGQRAAIYNHHTSRDGHYSVTLAGAADSLINENSTFSTFTDFRRTVHGYEMGSEEEWWDCLNPGMVLYQRASPDLTSSLHLPALKYGPQMYYRVAPGKTYEFNLRVLSSGGGERVGLLAKAYSQEGTLLWEAPLAEQTTQSGTNDLRYEIDLPGLLDPDTIYKDGIFDAEIQLALEAQFSSLDSDDLIIERVEFMRDGAGSTTQDAEMLFNGQLIGGTGPLEEGQVVVYELDKPDIPRFVAEGSCGGSRRFLWYLRQTDIDWQVRNAPVADHGAYLLIDEPTNIWSTDKEIVIVPASNPHDEIYVHRLKNVTQAKIWPLNRGNQQVSVEVLAGDAEEVTVIFRSPSSPSNVIGASEWTYSDGYIQASLPVGGQATVVF